MTPAHSDKEFPGAAFRRGNDGDARRGTVYGHRSTKQYNAVKVRATEMDEGRPMTLLHYARRIKNDNKICEFVVIGGQHDPGMKVMSRIPRTLAPATIAGDPVLGTVQSDATTLQEWPRIEEEGKYVFLAPD